MTLPLRTRATITSKRFLHAGAMENVTYTRTVQNYILSSGVHLSSPIRRHRVYGIDSMGLGNYSFFFFFLVTSRNNRFDAQTDISQIDGSAQN